MTIDHLILRYAHISWGVWHPLWSGRRRSVKARGRTGTRKRVFRFHAHHGRDGVTSRFSHADNGNVRWAGNDLLSDATAWLTVWRKRVR